MKKARGAEEIARKAKAQVENANAAKSDFLLEVLFSILGKKELFEYGG